MEKVEIADKQPQQIAATTGFLDQVAIENETVCLSGWVLSFESEPVTNFKVLFGSKKLTGFALTQGLPSPGVKKAHPNIYAANNARFIIRLPMNKQQQQEFKDALIILIPLVANCEGEPLLNAVTPALSFLVKTSEANNLPTTTPQVELISVHVPKAAGTAFRQVLLQVYGTQGVLTDKTNMFEDNMPASIHWQTKVIEGHFRAGKYDKLFPDARRITWLREPIHRLISDYCFRHISNPKKDHLNKEGLLKFAQGNSNLMTYCVNGKSLDYFDFVGITEYFAEDLLELKNLMGWSDYEVIYQNRNPYPEYVEFQKEVLSDKKLMADLAAINSEDMELYAAALKLAEGRSKEFRIQNLELRIQNSELRSGQEVRSQKSEVRSDINLPEKNVVDLEQYPVVEKTELLATLGSLDKAEFNNQELLLTGWVVSPNSGEVKGFNLTIADTRIEKFEAALNLPSPDVKKLHPNLNTSGKARFRLKVPLNSEQISQFSNCQIALIPIFKDGKGRVLSKVLVNFQQPNFSEAPIVLEESEQARFIAPIELITTAGQPLSQKSKVENQKSSGIDKSISSIVVDSFGYLEKVGISDKKLVIFGWVGSDNFGSVEGLKVVIGGQQFTSFAQELGLPSPDVAKVRPQLNNAENSRFRLEISLSQTELQNCQNSLIALTPIFQGEEGNILFQLFKPSLPIPDDKYIDGGASNFIPRSFKFLGDFIQRVGIQPTAEVLEIGCGIGNIAYGLSYYLQSPGRYEGFDFSQELISWAQENITTQKPHFNFRQIDSDFQLLYDDKSFDFVFIGSRFTQVGGSEIRNYLDDVYRVLKAGGRLLFNCFLVNHESEQLISEGKSSQPLIYRLQEGFTKDKNAPEKGMGFLESLLLEWVNNSGFDVLGKFYGSWSGRVGCKSYPDMLILEKSEGRNLEFRIQNSELISQNSQVKTEKSEFNIEKQEGRNLELRIENSELISQNSQVKTEKSEFNIEKQKGRNLELRIENSELISQNSQVKTEKSEFNIEKQEEIKNEEEVFLESSWEKVDSDRSEILQKNLPLETTGEIIPTATSSISPLLTEIMADLEKSQTEIQEIQADLEKFKSKKTNTSVKSLFLVEPDTNLSGLGEQTPTKKKILTNHIEVDTLLPEWGDKSSTKPVVEVNNLPEWGDKSSTKPVVEVNNLSGLGDKISTKPVVEVNNFSGLGDKISTKPVVEVNNFSGLGDKSSTKPVVEVNNFSGLGDKSSTKPVVEVNNLSGLGDKSSTKPVVEVNNLSELGNQTSTQQKQELLGLSGVTIEKFWEIINPVILMEGRRKQEEGRGYFSEFSLEGKRNREERRRDFSQPSISILTPTCNSSLDWFVETVLSVLNQSIPDWEWCIVDDGSKQPEIRNVLAGIAEKEPRIKVLFSEDNGGISAATNKALKMATGEFICLLDHDDTLAPTALENSLDKLAEGFDVVYSDEDKIDFSGLNYIHPFFKPDWSPEYFRGVMYVGHLLCVRREIALAVGEFNSEFDGVQDYEFMLRVSEQTNKIAHISQHLYHWRKVKGSISGDADAKAGIEVVQQAAVNAHLERIGLVAKAEPGLGRHRVNINPLPRKNYPLISLIIATPNISESLGQWLENFLSVSTYPQNEVILIGENGTENLIQNQGVKVLSLSGKFNYSRAYNLGAKTAQGEYFVFLNTNLEVAVEDWQRHLLYYAEQPDLGAVGGFLVFPNGTVEHAGIVLGKSGKVNYVMRDFPTNDDGYAGSLVCAREVSAVSRDCLMVSRENFELVGGFNEHFFSDYQDVDLCFKLRKKGKRILFTPRCVLINHESEKHRQENYDVVDYMLLLDQWQIDMDLGDPYWSREVGE